MLKAVLRSVLGTLFALVVLVAVCLSHTKTQNNPRGGSQALGADKRGSPQSNPGPKTLSIEVVQESNPLSKAAEQLSKHFGIPISYEEPAWSSDFDLTRLVDTPGARANSPAYIARINRRLKVAAVGSIEYRRVLQDTETGFDAAGAVLQDLLDDHGKRGNPGQFKLIPMVAYGYSIVPTSIRDQTGSWVPASSPLDARISFPAEERPLGESLYLIVKAVSEATHLKIEIEQVPGANGIFDNSRSMSGAQDEIARNVLARTLRQYSSGPYPTPALQWNLQYAINGNSVADETSPVLKTPVYNLRVTGVYRTRADGQEDRVFWPTNNNQRR